MNPWLKHVAEYRIDHPNKSYKECLIGAKASYKKQAGGNPVIAAVAEAAASGLGSVADIGGTIASGLNEGRDDKDRYNEKTGNYERIKAKVKIGTYEDAIAAYNKLLWRRDQAIMKKNKIPKTWSDAKLMKMSGLDKF